MSFRPGDLCVVIEVKGAIYPPDAQPGTIVTIEHRCDCPMSIASLLLRGTAYYSVKAPTRSLCAAACTLRKIDDEGRKPVDWESVPWQPEIERSPA